MSAAGTPILLGQVACLGAAALWAVSLGLFRGPIEVYGARRVNLAKCALAAALQGLTVLAAGQIPGLLDAPAAGLGWLVLSGLVGLAVGDTALFGAAARIGVHRALLLQTLAPVFAALLAAAWQGELPAPSQLLGGATILVGVALVVAPGRRARRERPRATPAWAGAGIALGLVAAMGQGAGVTLAKAGMEHVPVMAASFLRLSAAAAGLALLGALSPRPLRPVDRSRTAGLVPRILGATFLGTYVALFLMMAGVALAPAAIAAVLLSTSPVFSLVLEAVIDRRRIDPRGALGTLLAVAGVALLALG